MEKKSGLFLKTKDLLTLLVEEIKREPIGFSKRGQLRNRSSLGNRVIDLRVRDIRKTANGLELPTLRNAGVFFLLAQGKRIQRFELFHNKFTLIWVPQFLSLINPKHATACFAKNLGTDPSSGRKAAESRRRRETPNFELKS